MHCWLGPDEASVGSRVGMKTALIKNKRRTKGTRLPVTRFSVAARLRARVWVSEPLTAYPVGL
jgi:hypothetical protein